MLAANCDQRHVRRVGCVELQLAWILLRCEPRLAAGQILETNLGRRNRKVAGKQGSKCRTALSEVNPIFPEVKSAGAGDLIERQNAALGACRRRFVKAHSPHVNAAGWKRRCGRGLRPRTVVALLRVAGERADFLHLAWSWSVVTVMIVVHGGRIPRVRPEQCNPRWASPLKHHSGRFRLL